MILILILYHILPIFFIDIKFNYWSNIAFKKRQKYMKSMINQI